MGSPVFPVVSQFDNTDSIHDRHADESHHLKRIFTFSTSRVFDRMEFTPRKRGRNDENISN